MFRFGDDDDGDGSFRDVVGSSCHAIIRYK